ncbi:MAG: hypothetical protein AUG51_00645 [Acidobacteria bacterium 13_1_20CM_3_53_8]|nr:MAG: hypothetical protein AUG51_00645 [Acidobacteria bacterium 13_1_20CM_3_53_8]
MWDTKRQLIWFGVGFAFGTFVLYQDSHDEQGNFGLRFFIFMEALLALIMSVMFYFYSRRKP